MRTTKIIVYHREMTQGEREITKGRKKLGWERGGGDGYDFILIVVMTSQVIHVSNLSNCTL